MGEFIRFNRLIVLFLGVGFLVLAFEIFLQHHEVLVDKKIAWTPILFGTIGGILTVLVAIFFNRLSYYLFIVIMLISVCVGTLGVCLHNIWRVPKFLDFLFWNKPFDFEILTTYTPLLAPSAFVAMGGLGILVAVYHSWWKD